MTPKERKKWFRERVLMMENEKRIAKMRHDAMIATDTLMIKWRERMYLIGDLKSVNVIEGMRKSKIGN
jgi:hypothetical protein